MSICAAMFPRFFVRQYLVARKSRQDRTGTPQTKRYSTICALATKSPPSKPIVSKQVSRSKMQKIQLTFWSEACVLIWDYGRQAIRDKRRGKPMLASPCLSWLASPPNWYSFLNAVARRASNGGDDRFEAGVALDQFW